MKKLFAILLLFILIFLSGGYYEAKAEETIDTKCTDLCGNPIGGLCIAACTFCHRDCYMQCYYSNVQGCHQLADSCFSLDVFDYGGRDGRTCTCNCGSCYCACTEADEILGRCNGGGSTAGTQRPTGSACPWFDQLLQCADEEIVIITENGQRRVRQRRENMQRVEDVLHAPEPSDSALYTFFNWSLEDGERGNLARIFPPFPNPYEDSRPRTDAFFNQIDQIQGSSECDRMKQIYEAVTTAVPGIGLPFPGNAYQCYFGGYTFEEVLTDRTGECKERTMLLAAALRRGGVEARPISGPGHAWVRVTLREGPGAGREIDLDPTWYESFVPLKKRGFQSDPNYCR